MINDQNQQSSRYSSQVVKPDNNLPAKFPYFTPWLFVFTLIWLVAYRFALPDPLGLAASNWPLIIVGVAGCIYRQRYRDRRRHCLYPSADVSLQRGSW